MDITGLYLYGFARSQPVQGLELAGLEAGRPVCLRVRDGVAAVCSEVALGPFERAETPDPSWIVPRALRHEEIVEALMQRSPVLPVRFGTLFATGDSLDRFTCKHRAAIVEFLDETASKDEWSLKLLFDPRQAAGELIALDPSFAAQAQAMAEAPGTRYFQEKRWRAQAMKEAKARARERAEQIEKRLAAAPWATRKLSARGATGGAPEVVLHLAVLVPRAELEPFQEHARALLGAPDAPGVSLETIGPWPPFHFCPTLEAE